nr:reverse transcriptase domain-containing protein [Tanacetum cinerariifolium]
MRLQVHGFDTFRSLYEDDPGFRDIMSSCHTRHAEGLTGHFGHDKTLALLRDQFYWPRMKRNVHRVIESATDSVMVVVDRFSKMAHFVSCSKTFDAIQVVRLYFFGIVKLHEFAYNHSINRTTGKSPFEIVYGKNPSTSLDLAPIPLPHQVCTQGDKQSTQIKELHQQVRQQIDKHNIQYAARANKHRKRIVFHEGDLVCIYLRMDRFPAGRFGKLKPRVDGPFHVLKKINDNAYKLELPGHYNVSATFNVADLSPYVGDSEDEVYLRSSLSQEGEDDVWNA